ncbi:MAG: hypothetical protein ABEH40_08940 [Haloferacaceae archaeon]
MDLDPEAAGAWVGRWWTEAALGLIALAGAATAAAAGDAVGLVVAAALAAAVVDRLRLRLDNRSLAVAVTAVREGNVSTARRQTGVAPGEQTEGASVDRGVSPDDGRPDAGSDAGAEPGPGGTAEVDERDVADVIQSATDEE